MATYKDDLDILKAAEKADTNKLTFNAITELDNKGLLGRYGGEGEGGGGFKFDVLIGMVASYDTEVGGISTYDVRYLEGSYESAVEAYLNEESRPRFGILNELYLNDGCFGTLQIDGCEYDELNEVFCIVFTVPDDSTGTTCAAVLSSDGSIVVEENEVSTEEPGR